MNSDAKPKDCVAHFLRQPRVRCVHEKPLQNPKT